MLAPVAAHTKTNAMCATEEKAISTFISLACTHKSLTKSKLQIAILVKKDKTLLALSLVIIILTRPTPPNFKRTAARNIDPKTGASTWALGNHIWRNIRGSFTKNATSPAIATISLIGPVAGKVLR